ncbi:MAG: V4R domain-containing protein [Gemmatimonadota bacterium]
MRTTDANGTELRVPVALLHNLRRILREQSGELAAIHLLHDIGFATGESVHEQFLNSLDANPTTLTPDAFWDALDQFSSQRGWGRIRHERGHPGLGIIRSSDWIESDPQSEAQRPSCAFSAGVLAHLLGRVAQGSIAVLEVGCRSRGDDECAFLFGAEEAVHRAYGLMQDGERLGRALSCL